MTRTRTFLFTGLLFAAATAAAASSGAPVPDIVSVCNSPQQLNNMVGLGGNQVSAREGVVWNGQEFVVAYAQWLGGTSANTLMLQKVFADGTPDGPPVAPVGVTSYSFYQFPVSLAYDGTNYALAYISGDGVTSYWQAFFVKLGPNFNVLSGPTKVSFYGGYGETANSSWPQVAAAGNGSGYCVVWFDGRSGHNQVYATQLDGSGAVVNGGAAHDLALSVTAYDQSYPTVAWSQRGANGSGGFVVAWSDQRNVTHTDLYCEMVWGNGSLNYLNDAVTTPGTASATTPHLAATPSGFGLAWTDSRNSNSDIYFTPLSYLGTPTGSVVQVTPNSATQQCAFVVWTGSEFGVFWSDYRSGALSDVWFQRLSASGALLGSNVQATSGLDPGYPSAAFGKLGYVVVGDAISSQNYATAFGCNYAYQPSCPTNLVAYNITGTTATLSWQPAFDQYTDIAYYQVYRNSQPVARTAGTLYADTGLSLSTTYLYSVTAVNAADLPSTGCGTTNSVYLKTNATLLLAVNKSAPNAVLSWTDSQPLNSYNVFRGTSPQVMQQVGATSGSSFSDPNVLKDGVTYFYTVDEPGQ